MSPEPVLFRFRESGMHETFNSWSGDVGTHIARKAGEVETEGRVYAGFQSGALIANIRTSYGRATTSDDLEAHTGVNPEPPSVRGYAYWHHEGTLPHHIYPVQAKALRFVVNGVVVFAQHVFHPGTSPVKYLTRRFREMF